MNTRGTYGNFVTWYSVLFISSFNIVFYSLFYIVLISGKTETESTKPAPKPVPKQTRRVKSPRDPPENSQISAQDFLPVCSF